MEQNFYCGGNWYATYGHARVFADDCLELLGMYYVIMTRAEVESITNAIDKAIDHEMECGK